MKHWWVKVIVSLVWSAALLMACIAVADTTKEWLSGPLLPPHVMSPRDAFIVGAPIMERVIVNMIAIMAGFGYSPIWAKVVLITSTLIFILHPFSFSYSIKKVVKE